MRHHKPKNLKDIEKRKKECERIKAENQDYYQNSTEWHFPRKRGK